MYIFKSGFVTSRTCTLALLVLLLGAGGCVSGKTTPQPELQPVVEAEACPVPEAEQQAPLNEAEEVVELEVPPADDNQPLTEEEEQALLTQLDIDIEMDEDDRRVVESYIKYFTHRARGSFERYLERAEIYLPAARDVFRSKGLPEELVYLAFVESGFNPNAYSRAGAAGVWQFMPFTGRKYGLRYDWWIDERRDPYKSAEAASNYLSWLYGEFGDWYLALAAYNAGEGKIGRAIKGTGAESFFELTSKNHKLSRRKQLRRETQHYVPKFIAIVKIMRNLEELGFKPLRMDCAPELESLEVKGGTDLLALAEASGMKWDDFRKYNTAFLRYVSPPDAKSTVYITPAAKDKAVAFLSKAESRPYAGWVDYKVRNGDSWYRISRKYGVPIAVLKKVNRKTSNMLRPGQRLMIPRSGNAKPIPESFQATRAIAKKRGSYVVSSGDTLYDIARSHNTSVATLKRANSLRGNTLRPGQKLYIPGDSKVTAVNTSKSDKARKATVYKVRSGDSLWAIARKFNVTHNDLMQWNNLSRRSIIRPGDKLTVYVE
ncbi:LysM peptidoglycan-binding domain-containing protein [Oleidesulfovibrio sp.]|uniref:lytic transglycosylase n=1 Tax=Oleidesulfovibrio sp. TaxID=2909707 RepID=UPI003A83AA00